MKWKCNNRCTVYSPGCPSMGFWWCCWGLWLDSLFCLCPLVQDHSYDVCLPSDPLPHLPRLLLLQRINVCAADSAHLLGWAHLAHGHQIPPRQRKNSHVYFTTCNIFILNQQLHRFSVVVLPDRTSSRTSGAIKRRPSQKTKATISSRG